MLDRQKVEAILTRRFPGAGDRQVAAAANALMGLGDDWEEVQASGEDLGRAAPVECHGISDLSRGQGSEYRVLRRRTP